MSATPYFGKLAELRVKTDRDLVSIIGKELEHGLILASIATSKESPSYAKAETIRAEALTLLAKISSASENERATLATKVSELQSALARLPGTLNTQRLASCSL